MKNVFERSIAEQAQDLRAGEYSACELASLYLDRIEKEDSRIGAYLYCDRDKALLEAEKADEIIKRGNAPLLCGIPFALKDNICTEGIPTTAASKMLENYIPPYSATVYEKLRADGAVLLGKTNMDEFAMGSSTENSAFKITKNPGDTSRVPGGSSGGSAAAVAGGLASFALGSDTGGSVRCPASYCGCVGLKPTYGTVSRYGLIAFSPSLEQIGPMTGTVRDNALVYSAISGKDSMDSSSLDNIADVFSEIDKGVKGLRIGIAREFFEGSIDPEVKVAVLRAAVAFEKEGAILVDISLPSIESATAAYYIISSAEASSCLARYDGVRFGHRTDKPCETIEEMFRLSRSEGFGTEVKRRIMLGTFVLSEGSYDEYYKKAMAVKALVKRDYEKAFEVCDIILSPVCPTTAPFIGEETDPVSVYLRDKFCVGANLAGIPALSLPCGESCDGLSVGMQLCAPAFGESILYRAAISYEGGAK